jgi:hypothetical protein
MHIARDVVNVPLVSPSPNNVNDAVQNAFAFAWAVGHHRFDAGRKVFAHVRKNALKAEIPWSGFAVKKGHGGGHGDHSYEL